MNQILSLPLAVSLSVYNERLAVVLGILTLLSALTVFFSCRTGIKLLNKTGIKNLVANKSYQSFLKYHTYYWWTFWLVFVIHLLAAIMHLGFNTAGDPDAYLHKYSVIFGALALLTILVVGFSCRGIFTLVRLFSERKPTDFKLIGAVYKYHAYYWMLFYFMIAAHFTAGYLHSGWWATG
jgi:cytochrome b561